MAGGASLGYLPRPNAGFPRRRSSSAQLAAVASAAVMPLSFRRVKISGSHPGPAQPGASKPVSGKPPGTTALLALPTPETQSLSRPGEYRPFGRHRTIPNRAVPFELPDRYPRLPSFAAHWKQARDRLPRYPEGGYFAVL